MPAHFGFLGPAARAQLFAVPPSPFGRNSPPSLLGLALGATLYSPGTRPALARDAQRAGRAGATSHVWCLEDAIPHRSVPEAEHNVATQLQQVAALSRRTAAGLPLLFVRVRSPEQLVTVARAAGAGLPSLTGFVLPKFAPQAAEAWFAAVSAASDLAGVPVYAMPVLEHPDLAWVETREAHLAEVRQALDAHREQVLAVRVGGTDLCGLFGLRRDRDTTIWDVAVVRDALSDVLNIFARRGDYVVSGPVWEHLSGVDRLFKPQLRASPFERNHSLRLRRELLEDDVDELVREVALDRANGFQGKTVIHPTHVAVVNALSAVAREEYDDALSILAGRDDGGAMRSTGRSRMNEIGPHTLWAEQVLARAGVFGVLDQPAGVFALLEAGHRAAQRAYGVVPAPVATLQLPSSDDVAEPVR